jgi:16S rRNA (cytidine1402-2'-O)-methyltransferase
MTGRILLAATPIGNTGDGSARLWEALQSADVIAAEDTRSLKDLARRAGIAVTARVVAMHDHNEADAAAGLVEVAAGGGTVVVVSDAGMPTVSDPGFKVVRAAIDAGVTVSVLPGPSAVLAALAVSGLPTDRFCFEGFLPRKAGDRAKMLAALAAEPRTMVFFEAPHRVGESLEAMAQAFGADRLGSVSRELTKTYEETVRGTLGELAEWASGEVRGELVLVVAGRSALAPTADDVLQEALARVSAGERAKEVVAELAAVTGVPSRELYAAVIAARKAQP